MQEGMGIARHTFLVMTKLVPIIAEPISLASKHCRAGVATYCQCTGDCEGQPYVSVRVISRQLLSLLYTQTYIMRHSKGWLVD